MQNSPLSRYKTIILLLCFLLTPIYIYGQDLGSSNGLFDSKPSTKKKKTTPKKKSSKNKTRSSRKAKSSSSTAKKAPRRRNSTRRKTSTASNRGNISRNTVTNNRIKNNDVIIEVGGESDADLEGRFEQAIFEGNTSRNLRNYLKAEEAYSRATSLNPQDSRAIYGLGNIYSDQQRWEEAEKAYRQAIKIDPDNPAAHIAISFVLTQPVVGSNLGERYEEAEKMARRAIALDSKNAIAYDQLGVALELRGLIGSETENAYRKAIELAPEFALAYAHLGRLLRRHGLTSRSSAAYRKAIQLSNDVPTMILVADVMQSQQRYLDSEQLLRSALRQDPKNPTGLYLLGRALTTRKNFKEAEEVLKKSVEVSPKSFVSYALLGSMYYRSGELVKAEAALTQALSVISNNEKKRLAQEFEEIGDRHLKSNNYADALRVYQRAKDLDMTKNSLNIKIAQAKNKNL